MQLNLAVTLHVFFCREEKTEVAVSQLGSSTKGIIGIFSEVYHRNSPNSVGAGERITKILACLPLKLSLSLLYNKDSVFSPPPLPLQNAHQKSEIKC